jgi:hypothetical protein
MQIRTQSTMTTENLLINDRSYGQAVEAIRECFPQFYIVTAFAFVVKSWQRERSKEN